MTITFISVSSTLGSEETEHTVLQTECQHPHYLLSYPDTDPQAIPYETIRVILLIPCCLY